MKIKIHSISSAITNSSTTVYCYASRDGMEHIKSIVNEVLKIANSNKTFDDLYEISIVYDNDILDHVIDEHYEKIESLSWEEKASWAKQYIKDNPDETYENWMGYSYPTHYEIITKDSNETNLNLINSLFDHEGFRDG